MSRLADNPPDGGSSIAVDTAHRRPSFLRVLLVVAATVVALVGMRLAAPVLNPILFAVVLTAESSASEGQNPGAPDSQVEPAP
jgi:hypothetical protein